MFFYRILCIGFVMNSLIYDLIITKTHCVSHLNVQSQATGFHDVQSYCDVLMVIINSHQTWLLCMHSLRWRRTEKSKKRAERMKEQRNQRRT